MSDANVEIIRRHYDLKAEAFRGGDVRAFLEIVGPICPSERPRPDEDERIARKPARHERQPSDG